MQFALQYTDKNREKLNEYTTEETLLAYLKRHGVMDQFIRFADSKGVKRRNILIQRSYKKLERNVYGNIIYNMLGKEAYIKYFNESDPTIKEAVKVLEAGEAFPKAPQQTEKSDSIAIG